MTLVSPVTGQLLRPDTDHSVTDGATRWPVIDAIPFLRTNRAELAAEAALRVELEERARPLARLYLGNVLFMWQGGMHRTKALESG